MSPTEAKKIVEIIDAFALEMKAKLLSDQANNGSWEWYDKRMLPFIRDHLTEAVSFKDDHKALEIAIYAMMIWSHIPTEFDITLAKTQQMLQDMKGRR